MAFAFCAEQLSSNLDFPAARWSYSRADNQPERLSREICGQTGWARSPGVGACLRAIEPVRSGAHNGICVSTETSRS